MANQKFVGAIATQYYSWGYTCELCGMPVEKRSGVSARNGSMHKSTTWASIDRAGAEAMKDQARMQLAVGVAQMDEKIRNEGFEIPQGEEGKCPHCKQYQHWAPEIQSQIAAHNNPKSRRGDKLAIGWLTFFVGMWVSLGLLLLLDKLLAPGKDTWMFVLGGSLLFGFLVTWIVVWNVYKRSKANLDAQVKVLENVEKNEPRFIAWAEQSCDTYGLSIH